MFQPLLDAYIDSTHLDETTHKPPPIKYSSSELVALKK